jgi:hypothetical protein
MANKDKEETEDEHFARRGSFSSSFKVKIKVTEEDLLKDLVKKTEGKNIIVADLDNHNKN